VHVCRASTSRLAWDCFRITASPESTTCLYGQNAWIGRLASFTSLSLHSSPSPSKELLLWVNIIVPFNDHRDGDDRVCNIDIDYPPSSQLGEILAAMQRPFPVLILRLFALKSILFPELLRLLPSTTQLILLCLRSIPDSGYISSDST